MKRNQRIISFLLVLVMVIGMVPPMDVSAEETEPTQAVTEATEETNAPTEMVPEPAKTTAVLSEPETEPTEAATVPTETKPIEETNALPTEPVTEPTVSTEPATESTDGAGENIATDFVNQNVSKGVGETSGTCGENLTWELDSTGVLLITGTGPMTDWTYYYEESPWHESREQIKSVVIDNGVTSIGNKAFFFCYNLETVIIPDSITSIGQNAFAQCSNLAAVDIPNSVSQIGYHAFYQCSSLVSITIPNGITELSSQMFYGCSSLTTISIPASVASIGEQTFWGCESLIKFQVDSRNNVYASDSTGLLYTKDYRTLVCCPAGLKHCEIPTIVEHIGNYAFLDCSALNTVTIPYGVTSIGEGAFKNCYNLSAITIPDSVTSIGESAFYLCRSLSAITIPYGIVHIGRYAFWGCYGLTTITLPDSVISIGDYVFCNCSSLDSITIPASVTGMGKAIFSNCEKLKSIYFCGNAPTFDSTTFSETDVTVFYPVDNTTWTETVHGSYDGNVFWRSYVVNADDLPDVNSAFIDQVSVICYVNQNASELPEENFVFADWKATATIGSDVYHVADYGQFILSGKPEDLVTFSQDGYVSRTFSLKDLEDDNRVYLQKESDAPIIYALWSDVPWRGYQNILQITLGMEYASDDPISLTPEIDWGESGPGSLGLYQEGRTYSLTNGTNTFALASEFDINKDIYLIAKGSNGKTAQKLLKISNASSGDWDEFTFNLVDGLNFELPKNAGLLSGKKMKFDVYDPFPVVIAQSEGKVLLAVGYQMAGEYDKNGKDVYKNVKDFKDNVKEIQKICRNVPNEVQKHKKVRDQMKRMGDKLAKVNGSFGVDGYFSVMVFAEGTIVNGQFEMTDSGGILMFGASAHYTQDFLAGPVPMYFEIKLSGDVEAQINLYLNEQIKEFTPRMEIEGVIALAGGAGLGSAKIASFGGGLKGKLLNYLNANLGKIEYYRLDAALDWYLKLKIVCLTYEWGDTIKKATWYEYPDPGSSIMTLSLDDEIPEQNGGKPDCYDSSQYTMDDLSYLEYGSNFMGSGVATFSGRNLNNNAPFVSNAYEGADPQTVSFSDGTRLAVWIGYNDSLSGADALNLYYSYYNGAWSQPQVVEQDGTSDSYPDLKIISDTAYLVWQDAYGSIGNDATLDSIATLMDISGAVFDKESESFVSSAVTTSSGVLNMQPKLCGDSSAVYVVWHRNGENDWFGQNSANSLWCSSFSEGSWSTPISLYSGLAPLLDFDVACWGGYCTVAYTMDSDGDLNTTEDLEVYLDGSAMSENEYLDSGVTFSGYDLYWYSGGKLLENGNGIMPEGVYIGSDRFQIVDEYGVHAVVYVEEDGMASVLKAAYYDAASGNWGAPVTLYSTGTSITAFSASATSDGEISVLIQNQEVAENFDGTDPYGLVSLVWYNAPMGCDIRVDDVRYYNENYVLDNYMPVYITVTNTGELAVQKLQIDLTNEEGSIVHTEIVKQKILSGETREIEFLYHVDDVARDRNLILRVTPVDMEDIYSKDNTGEMTLGWEDLAVEDVRAGVTESGEIIIHANIVNRGYQSQSDVTVTLRESTASGNVVKTTTVESMAALSRYPVSFVLGAPKSRIYYVSIDHKETDSNYANDSEFISLVAYMDEKMIYGDNAVVVHKSDLSDYTSVWIDGVEYVLKQLDTTYYVNLPDGGAKTMVAYTCHTDDPSDVHTQYPVSMKVWTLKNENGVYTATRVEELDNILQYSGSSIRVTGKQGVRMLTSIEKGRKNSLIADGLEGYTLKEYGTVIAWASQLTEGNPLVLGESYSKSNYAYKKGIADPVFAYDGDLMQYTNVLVGFSLDQCKDDIAMRPYMILTDEEGNDITLYGGIVQRSIGYIAYQNRNTFIPGTEAYNYVWDIIHHVYGNEYDAEYKG